MRRFKSCNYGRTRFAVFRWHWKTPYRANVSIYTSVNFACRRSKLITPTSYLLEKRSTLSRKAWNCYIVYEYVSYLTLSREMSTVYSLRIKERYRRIIIKLYRHTKSGICFRQIPGLRFWIIFVFYKMLHCSRLFQYTFTIIILREKYSKIRRTHFFEFSNHRVNRSINST